MATATIGSLTFTRIDTTSTCSVTKNGNPSGSIVIPSSVTLNDGLPYQVTNLINFYDLTYVTRVTIPSSVTSLGDYAFIMSPLLTSITVDANNANYSNDSQGILYNKDKSILIACPGGLTSITIPNTVTSIGYTAFAFCSGLTSITIPNSVTSIGSDVFNSCSGLTSVTIGTGVTSIGTAAFYNCPSSIKMYFLGSTIPTLTYIFGEDSDWNGSTIPKTQGTAYYLRNLDDDTDTQNTNKLTPYFTTLNKNDPVVCFVTCSKILTDEGYKNIETLRRGDKVKTLKDGCKEIKMIGNMSFINDVSSGNPSNRIYKLSKEQYPELTEDLYVTGLHPILVDESSKCYNSEDGKYIIKSYHTQTDGKYRLPCCNNENAELIKEVKEVTVWDFVLENDSDVRRQYGIWANGLLTETLDEYYFKDKNLFEEV